MKLPLIFFREMQPLLYLTGVIVDYIVFIILKTNFINVSKNYTERNLFSFDVQSSNIFLSLEIN